MKNQITQQKSSDQSWKDEAGTTIPYSRVTNFERKAERKLAQVAREAIGLNEKLTTFKTFLKETAEELYAAFIAENGGKAPGKGKGGVTLFNFDRSLKVEVSVNESIVFDDNLISLAKDKLDELLNDGLEGAKDFVKPLVMDAFQTSGGRLDTKRVLSLKRYADRVTDPRYGEAMDFIDKAIRKPKSKEYFRVWVRDGAGEYQDIQLNLSAI